MALIERFKRTQISKPKHSGEIIATPKRRFDSKKLTGVPFLAGLAVILIIAGILIGRSIHHHNLTHDQNLKPASSQANKQAPTAIAPSNSQSSTNNSSSQPKSASSSTANTPTTITNTGPGSTLAIFLGASFIGAALHRAFKLRSQN